MSSQPDLLALEMMDELKSRSFAFMLYFPDPAPVTIASREIGTTSLARCRIRTIEMFRRRSERESRTSICQIVAPEELKVLQKAQEILYALAIGKSGFVVDAITRIRRARLRAPSGLNL